MSRIEYPVEALVPAEWQSAFAGSDFFTYNPSMLRYGGQLLMTYRISTRHYTLNQSALCLLDAHLQVQSNSARPLFGPQCHPAPLCAEDVRLFEHDSHLWAIYNDSKQPNLLYLVKIDPATWQAAGRPRPMILPGRMFLEKNWMPFSRDGQIWVLYSIHPQVVLRLDLSDPEVVRCEQAYETRWDDEGFRQKFGEWHGGNAPTLHEGLFWVFPHMVAKTSLLGDLTAPLRRWAKRLKQSAPVILADGDVRPRQVEFRDWFPFPQVPGGWRGALLKIRRRLLFRHYVLGVYAFEANPPFTPRLFSYRPILRANHEPAQRGEPLEIDRPQVVFASGAVVDENQAWRVAYGLNEEVCIVQSMSQGELLRHCRPVKILAEG